MDANRRITSLSKRDYQKHEEYSAWHAQILDGMGNSGCNCHRICRSVMQIRTTVLKIDHNSMIVALFSESNFK